MAPVAARARIGLLLAACAVLPGSLARSRTAVADDVMALTPVVLENSENSALAPGYGLSVAPVAAVPEFMAQAAADLADECPVQLRAIIEADEEANFAVIADTKGSRVVHRGDRFVTSGRDVQITRIAPGELHLLIEGAAVTCKLNH